MNTNQVTEPTTTTTSQQSQLEQLLGLLAAQQEQIAALAQSKGGGKGKKTKRENPKRQLPAPPKGMRWERGEAQSSGKTYMECQIPGSRWKLRVYDSTNAVCLCHGRNFIYAEGVAALENLAEQWPGGFDFLRSLPQENEEE